MSNYLAIATTTAALSQILAHPVRDAVGSSATISFKRPNGKEETAQGNPHVNVYLYQVTPNAAFRNADLPTRRADGTLAKRPVAALDLHYLFTFHGKDEQLEPQRMLGAVVSVMEAQPVLSPQIVQAATSAYGFLSSSDLGSQIEKVRFTPTTFSLEEFSKLWSAFFQIEYALSIAYQASVVLIESSQAPPQPALPVQSRSIYVATFTQPTITGVSAQTGPGNPILPTSTLAIQGTQLLGDLTTVRIGGVVAVPPVVTETSIVLPVPPGVEAGVQGLQVIQQMLLGTPPLAHPSYESNVVALVLQPLITPQAASAAQVSLNVNPTVGTGQKVSLLLNGIPVAAPATPAAYTFPLSPLTAAASVLDFPIAGVAAGTYFVRVRIDGAENPLDLDPASPTFGPTVTIP